MFNSKQIARGIIAFVVYVFILISLFVYIGNNADIMHRIFSSQIEYAIYGIICSGISVVLTGLMEVYCVRVYGVNLKYLDAVGITFIASACNLFLPFQCGSVIKAMYLKRTIALSYSKYVSIVSGTIIVNFSVILFQLLVSLFFVFHENNVQNIYMILAGGIILLLLYIFVVNIFLKYKNIVFNIIPFKRMFIPVLESFCKFLENKKALFCVISKFVLSAFLGGISFNFTFLMLGYDSTIFSSMLYYAIYTASTIIPILPGNVGISEFFVGTLNSILTDGFVAGVTLVLITRVYYYIASVMGASMFLLPVWHRYVLTKKE